ncbi:hypothetical protein ACHAWF_015266 [Thalassiosira exigua]
MSIAASKLQQRRQDQECVYQNYHSFLDRNHNTQRVHDWEHRTQQQIEQREVEAIAQKLLQEDEEELCRRKDELGSLFDGEMSKWAGTLKSSLEVTPEQRMEQIRKRAYELKEKREAERKEFVNECYIRQWRDACDDLRVFDSKATLDRIVKDRQSMIENNKLDEARQGQSKNEVAAMSLITKDESDEQSQRRQSSLAFKTALDHQVEWKRSLAESTMKQTQREDQEELQMLAMLEKRAQEAAKIETEKAKMRGRDMLQETKVRAKNMEEQQRSGRGQNRLLLQHAIETEKQQIAAERAKKSVGKEAASEYVQCLQDQARLEEKENEHVNRIRDAELRRIAKANDDKIKAEAEMKRRWMEEMDITRQEQIRRKRAEVEALRKEEDQEAEDIKAALLRAEEADRRDAEKAAALRMETMLANKATMEKRARERESERQEKTRIQNRIKEDERLYLQTMEDHKC